MNGWRAVWAVARHDLALHLAQPLTLFMTLAVPISFLILFVLFAISGGGAPVAVHQADSGPYGPALVAALQNTGTFRVEPAGSPGEALAAIEGQRAVAALTVPPGFSRAIAAKAPVLLSVTLDNQNDDFASDIRRGLPQAILQFYRNSLPERLPLTWRETDTYPRTIGFLPYIAVSLLTVALLIAGLLIGSFGMVREWQHGTMKELRLAPVSGWAVVAGKVAATFVLGLVAALVELGVLRLIGVRPQAWGPVAAVVPLVLLVFVSLGVAAGTLLRSQNKTMPLVFGLGLPLFFISGPFGPITWGTPATAAIARLFPVVYANTALQQAVYGFWVMDAGPRVVWVLGGWAVAAVLASAWAYRWATAPRDS